jgi:hypothetical protein
MFKNRKICKQVKKIVAHKIHNTVSSLWEYYSQYHKLCKGDKGILQYRKFLPMAYTQPWKAVQENTERPIAMLLIRVH